MFFDCFTNTFLLLLLLLLIIFRSLKALDKCVKEYTQNCMSKTAKQSISVLLYSISKTNKGYCSGKKRKEALLDLSKCCSANKSKLDEFMDIMTREFHGIRNYRESKLRIPLACCSYFKFKRNVIDLVQQKCSNQATEMEGLIDGYAHDILNLVCGDYSEDSDKCKTIESKTPKWKKPLESKNFVLPLADIFDSI